MDHTVAREEAVAKATVVGNVENARKIACDLKVGAVNVELVI